MQPISERDEDVDECGITTYIVRGMRKLPGSLGECPNLRPRYARHKPMVLSCHTLAKAELTPLTLLAKWKRSERSPR